ncbi:MAG: hypothetical protein ACI92E_003346 [Oceanicoccus sp.]|jgi:hypothetical protein
MDKDRKTEIKRQYKEESQAKGIYSARCTNTGNCWIDSSTNLTGSKNRLNFSLKTGLLLNKELQIALKAHGPEGFEFEILETFDPELSSYELGKRLKERRIHWQEALSAKSLHR